MNNEQIAFMKENLCDWAYLDEDQREDFRSVGRNNLIYLRRDGIWTNRWVDKAFVDTVIYRLKPDYQPPEEKIPEKLDVEDNLFKEYAVVNLLIDYLHSVEARLLAIENKQ